MTKSFGVSVADGRLRFGTIEQFKVYCDMPIDQEKKLLNEILEIPNFKPKSSINNGKEIL